MASRHGPEDARSRDLQDRLADLEAALAADDTDGALEALAALARLDPEDPAWPKRRAELHRQRGEPGRELEALVRAAELQTEAGQVARAIATCSRILDIDPEHVETQDRLQLLYEIPTDTGVGPAPGGSVEPPWIDLSPGGSTPDEDAPIEELVLTEVVSEARPAEVGDHGGPGAAEIPLGAPDQTEPLDLKLEAVDLDEAMDPESLPAPHATPDETQSQLMKGALLRALGAAGARQLFDHSEVVDLPPGARVFRQGELADRLFVILDGAVVPVAEGEVPGTGRSLRLGVLESGDFFGEIGILANQPRNATVSTLVETRLLAIERRVVWRLVREHPEALALLLRTLRVRLVDRLVRTNPLFAVFGRAKRSAFARQFRMLEVTDGATVIRQGLTDQGLYVILAGRFDVIEELDDGSEKHHASLGHGEVFGEFSSLCAQPASATVVARGKGWLFALSQQRLEQIARENPRLHELLRELAQQREADRRLG